VGGAGSAVRYDSFGVRDVGGKGKGKGRERFPGERGQAFEMSGAMRGEEGMRREDGNQGWHSAIGPQWERGRPSLGSHQVPAGRSTSHSGRVVDGSRLRR